MKRMMWFLLTALQFQRAVLCVKRETAEVHGAKGCDGDPGSTANTGEGTATSEMNSGEMDTTSEPLNTSVMIHVHCSGSCGDRRPSGMRPHRRHLLVKWI